MKEFEKWWDRVGQYEFSTYLTKEQSKIIWRAGLEWVVHEMNIIYAGDMAIIKLGPIIKKELLSQQSNQQP